MPKTTVYYELGSDCKVGDVKLKRGTPVAELRITEPACDPQWFAKAVRNGIVTASTNKPEPPNPKQPKPAAPATTGGGKADV